jgi:hypothetical protein
MMKVKLIPRLQLNAATGTSGRGIRLRSEQKGLSPIGVRKSWKKIIAVMAGGAGSAKPAGESPLRQIITSIVIFIQ